MRFGLVIQLVLFATLLVISSVLVSTWLAYQNSKTQLEESLANELLALVNSTAPFIDAELHEGIVRIDEDFVDGWDNFKQIHQQLNSVKRTNGLKKSTHGSPLYTLRKNIDFEQNNMLEFVTMTDRNSEGIFFIGYELKAEPHHIKALNGSSTVTGIYRDSEGDWISAAAPIYDNNRQVVGLVQADRHVSFFYKEVTEVAVQLLIAAIFTSIVAIIFAVLFARRLVKPVIQVVQTAKAFGEGDYSRTLDLKRSDEIGFLGKTFNKMAQSIREAQANEYKQKEQLEILSKELANANKGLEARVKTRTHQLEESNVKLGETLESLKQSQATLLQSEKMASLGQLAAGVAHEINNPMAFIISNMKTLEEYIGSIIKVVHKVSPVIQAAQKNKSTELDKSIEEYNSTYQSEDMDFLIDDSSALLVESIDGANRVKDIVMNLKGYSHIDTGSVEDADINECIESTLKIARNETKYNCEVVKDFHQLPKVWCNPSKLSQVFLNLVVNAAQSIQGEGKITITTQVENEFAVIKVSDTGKGIEKDNIDKLFEAFYTTKAVGEGTGLGLYIVYGIVQEHHGEIVVDSEIGKGTTFTVKLPVAAHLEKVS